MSIFAEAFESNGEPMESRPIPDGEYTTRLIDVTESANPINGIVSTTLEFEITEGDHERRRVWDSVKHEDNFMWKVAKVWTSLGLKGMPEDWSEFTRGINQNCKNRHFDIRVKTRSGDNGKTYTNVLFIKPDTDKPPF